MRILVLSMLGLASVEEFPSRYSVALLDALFESGHDFNRATRHYVPVCFRSHTGKLFDLLVTCKELPKAGDSVRRFLIAATDTSEMRRLERAEDEALRETKRLAAELDSARREAEAGRQLAERHARELSVVIDSMADGLLVVDPQGNCISANPAAVEMLGFSGQHEYLRHYSQFSNTFNLEYLDGTPGPVDEGPMTRLIRGETVKNYRARVKRLDNDWRKVISFNGSVSRDDAGNVLHYLLGLRDVSNIAELEDAERKARLEAEQKAAEWEAVWNGTSDAVFLSDENGRLVNLNSPAMNLVGHDSLDSATGMAAGLLEPLFKVTTSEGQPIPPEERPLNLVLKGRPVSNFQMRFIDLKGQEHEVLVNAAAVDTPAGKRAFAIMRDVTDIRILERSRQEFMQVVSHEMRNPLQVIKGLVQLIEMRLANEGGQAVGRHLKALGNQITFLTALVDDILTAYRLGTGKMTIRAQEVPLLNVVSEAVAPYLNDQIHSLHTSYTVPETLLVKADPQRVAQIVSNLLSNATKYTPEGKQIWVKTSMVGDSAAAVRVEDEGIGIPSDQLEKVFEGFVRAHNVTEWMSGGIGLGLYISRNLARRMGGDLWAEQRPGGGTIMTLTLPLGESGQKRYPTILSGCV